MTSLRLLRPPNHLWRPRPCPRPQRPASAALGLLAVAGLAGALAFPGCAATNFLDPERPRYYGGAASAKTDAAAEDGGRALRLVTFNIQLGREVDRAVTLLQTADALRRPDILLLQEMAGPGVERMAGALGLNYLSFPSGIHPQAHQEFGTAILSWWPIVQPEKIILPHGAAFTGLRRAVTAATVLWRGVPVRVYAVHLPSPMAIADSERIDQVRAILDAARAVTGPVIVAGDFNSRGVGGRFEREGFTWVTRTLSGTSRGPGVWLPFDHVFAKGFEAAGGTWSAGIVDAAGISDHRAVWARFRPPSDLVAPVVFQPR